MRILCFGSLNLDYVYQVPHFVQPGETLSALVQSVHPGGKGMNQSIALARAGAQVSHAGCLGQGGSSLRTLLDENGVETICLKDVDALQGNAVIQVIPSGENCILLYGGSNRCVTPEQIDETLSRFDAGDFIVLQNEINLLPEIVEAAHAKGLSVFLNPSPCNDAIRNVNLAHVDWLLVNEIEACQLSGHEDPDAAWKTLHSLCPTLSMVVTLGKAGCVAFHESGVVRQPAFPVQAVDTTAAGDTFTGFFIAALAENLPLETCLCRASMAAAISVTRAGAVPSIPARSEVDQALAAL